jgi:hypothetical protein
MRRSLIKNAAIVAMRCRIADLDTIALTRMP